MGLVMWGALPDERSGLLLLVVAGHRQHSLSQSESQGTHEHYLPLIQKEREKEENIWGWYWETLHWGLGQEHNTFGLKVSQAVYASSSGRDKASDQN
jgi:hypothetical protein